MENTKGMIFGREPVVILALVQSIVSAVVVFGLDLSMEQQTAVIVLCGALLTVIARQNVTPTTKLPEVVVGVEQPDGEVAPAVLLAEQRSASEASLRQKAEVEEPKKIVVDRRTTRR